MLNPRAKMTLFLNDKKLERMIDGGKRRALFRAGSKQRGIMRRLIKRRKKKKSPPGSPPFSHTSGSEFGIRFILFAFDENTYSMIVGPVGKQGSSGESVPGTLERGGVVKIRVKKRGGGTKIVNARMKPRPFADPAFDLYKDKYKDEYKDLLK